ncbi:MAG: protein-disulfide reductase DsbD [Gammaproteobacteria bacterium]|nr:protein-disulfide reductase DsbD [Gammaproteobacteria bacterium]MYD75666.1 protein-disulfide reductase DsbD [Gammaproteobacteria bacterium]MYJ51879.1 protein-disulfide reductase DsbD [Gammaproteobacteria bacterium]
MLRLLSSLPALLLVLGLAPGTICGALAQGLDDDELLPEDQAFRFELVPGEPSAIQATWRIAEGYYMYRDKIGFRIDDAGFSAAVPEYPQGIIKDDPLFGVTEVYTDQFSIRIDVGGGDGAFTLISDGQGCNEPIGVCYAPITHTTRFVKAGNTIRFASLVSTSEPEAEAAETTEQAQVEAEDIDLLRDLLSSSFSQPEFLDVDEAFRVEDLSIGLQSISGHFVIEPGYYLYRDKVGVMLDELSLAVRIPQEPEQYADPTFGTTDVHRTDFSFSASRPTTSAAGPAVVTLTYQGCAEGAICYPPVTRQFNLVAPAMADETPSAASSSTPATEQDYSLIAILSGAFIAGILLTFTPCVLPMIPILSSVIAGQGEAISRTRAGSLSLSYVLGTVITYAAMGALAGATGDQLQAYFQNAWAIGILSGILALMALSMFGLYELQVPSFLQSRIQQKSGSLTGSIPLVFLLGLVSALIIGACVSPVLISILSIAVATGDPVLGAQTMAVMALGMGVPLISIGVGAGYLLPKAGVWMESIKYLFGILLFAVAIYLLQILPQVPILLIWGAYLIIVGYAFMQARAEPDTPKHKFTVVLKGVGVVLLVWGICALIGGFMGQRDLLRPIPERLFTSGPAALQSAETHLFDRISTVDELDQQIVQAASNGRGVIIDYYADWCVDCLKMEESTFKDKLVIEEIGNRFIALQVDVTNPNDANANSLKKRFNVFGPPAMIFLGRNGTVLSDFNFYGYKGPEAFLEHLKRVTL